MIRSLDDPFFARNDQLSLKTYVKNVTGELLDDLERMHEDLKSSAYLDPDRQDYLDTLRHIIRRELDLRKNHEDIDATVSDIVKDNETADSIADIIDDNKNRLAEELDEITPQNVDDVEVIRFNAVDKEIDKRKAIIPPKVRPKLQTVEAIQRVGLENVIKGNPVMLVSTLSGDQRGLSILVETNGQRLLINAGGAVEEMLGYAAFTHSPTSYLVENSLNTRIAEIDMALEAKREQHANRYTTPAGKEMLAKEINQLNNEKMGVRKRLTTVKRGLESVTDVLVTNVDNSTTEHLARIQGFNPRVNVYANKESVVSSMDSVRARKSGIMESVQEFLKSGGRFKHIEDGVSVSSMKTELEGLKIHVVEVGRGAFGAVIENVETGGRMAYIPLADRGREAAVKKLLTGFGELNAIYMQSPATTMQLAINADPAYVAYYGNKLLADDMGKLIAGAYANPDNNFARALQTVELVGADDNLFAGTQASILSKMLNAGATEKVRVGISSPLRGQTNSIFVRVGRNMTVLREMAISNATADRLSNQAANIRSKNRIIDMAAADAEADMKAAIEATNVEKTALGLMQFAELEDIEDKKLSGLGAQFPGLNIDEDVPVDAYRRDQWIADNVRKNVREGGVTYDKDKKLYHVLKPPPGGEWDNIKKQFEFDPLSGTSKTGAGYEWRKILVDDKRFGRKIGEKEKLINILVNRDKPKEAQAAFDVLVDAQYIVVPDVGGKSVSHIAGRFELVRLYNDAIAVRGDAEAAVVKGMENVANTYRLVDPQRIKNIYMSYVATLMTEYDNGVLSTVGEFTPYSSKTNMDAIKARSVYTKMLMQQFRDRNVVSRQVLSKARVNIGSTIDVLLKGKGNKAKFLRVAANRGFAKYDAEALWGDLRAATAKIMAENEIRNELEEVNKKLHDSYYSHHVPKKLKKGATPKVPVALDTMKYIMRKTLLNDEDRLLARLEGTVELYANAVDQFKVVVAGKRMFYQIQEKDRNILKAKTLRSEIDALISAKKAFGVEFTRYVHEYNNTIKSLQGTNFVLFDAPDVFADYGTEKAGLVMAVRNDLEGLLSDENLRGAKRVIHPKFAAVVAQAEAIDAKVGAIRESEIKMAKNLREVLETHVNTEMRIFAHEMDRVKGDKIAYKKVFDKAVEFVQGRLGLLPKETQPDIVAALPKMENLRGITRTVELPVRKHAIAVVDTVVDRFNNISRYAPFALTSTNKYVVRNDVRETFSEELVELAERRETKLYQLDKIMQALQRIPGRIWGIQRQAVTPGAGAGTHAAEEVLSLTYDELHNEARMVQLARAKDVMLAGLVDTGKEIESIGYQWAKIIATNPIRYAGSIEVVSNLNKLQHVPGYLVRDMDILHTDMGAAILEKARVLELHNQVQEIMKNIQDGGAITRESYEQVVAALVKVIPFNDRKVFSELILPEVERFMFINEPTIRRQQMTAHAQQIYNAFQYRVAELSARIDNARGAIDRVVSYATATTKFPTISIERERFAHDIDRTRVKSFMLAVNSKAKIDRYVLPDGWSQGFGDHGPAMHMDLVRKYGLGYTKNDAQSAFMFPMRDEVGKLVYKVNLSYNMGMDQAEKALAEAEVLANMFGVNKVIAEVPTSVFTGVGFDEVRYPLLSKHLSRIKLDATETPRGIEGAGGQFGILSIDGRSVIKQFPTVVTSWDVRSSEINQEILKARKDIKAAVVEMPDGLVRDVYDFMGVAVSQAGTESQYAEYSAEMAKVRKLADVERISKSFVRTFRKQVDALDAVMRRGDEIFYASRTSKSNRGVVNLAVPRIPMLLYVDGNSNIRVSRLQPGAQMDLILKQGVGILPTGAQFSVIIDQAADGAYVVKNREGTLPDYLSNEVIYHKVSSLINAITNGSQEATLTQAMIEEARERAAVSRILSTQISVKWDTEHGLTGEPITKKEIISIVEIKEIQREENAILIAHMAAMEHASSLQPSRREVVEQVAIKKYENDMRALYTRLINQDYKFSQLARIKNEYFGVADVDMFGVGAPDHDGKIVMANKKLGAGGVTIRFEGMPEPEFSSELIDADIEFLSAQRALHPDDTHAIQERIAMLRAYRPISMSKSKEITLMPGAMPTFNKMLYKNITQRAVNLSKTITPDSTPEQRLVLERLLHLANEAREGMVDSQRIASMQRFLSGAMRDQVFMGGYLPQLIEERDTLLKKRSLNAVQRETLQGLDATIRAYNEKTGMRTWAVRQLGTIGSMDVEDYSTIHGWDVARSVRNTAAQELGKPYLAPVAEHIPAARNFVDMVMGVNRDYVGLFEELEDLRERAQILEDKRSLVMAQRMQRLGGHIKSDIETYTNHEKRFSDIINTFEKLFWDGPVRRTGDPVKNAGILKQHLRNVQPFRPDQISQVEEVLKDAMAVLRKEKDEAAVVELKDLLKHLSGINNENVLTRSSDLGINEAHEGVAQARMYLERLNKARTESESAEGVVKLQTMAEELSSSLIMVHDRIGVLDARVEGLPNIVKSTYGKYAVLSLRPKFKLKNIASELDLQQKVLMDPLKSADDVAIAKKAIAALEKEQKNIEEFVRVHTKDVRVLRKQIEQHKVDFGARDRLSVPYLVEQAGAYRTKAYNLSVKVDAAMAAGVPVSKEHIDLIAKYKSTEKMLLDSTQSKQMLYHQLEALYAEEQATRAEILKFDTIRPEYREIGRWAEKYREVVGKLDMQREGIRQIENVLSSNDKLWFVKSLFMDVEDVHKMWGTAIDIARGKRNDEIFVHEIRQRRIDLGLMRAVNKLAQNRAETIMALMDGYFASQNGLAFGQHPGAEDKYIFKGIKHRKEWDDIVAGILSPADKMSFTTIKLPDGTIKQVKGGGNVEMIKALSNFGDFYVDMLDNDMKKEVLGEMVRKKLDVRRGTQDITGGLMKIEKLFEPARKRLEDPRVAELADVYRGALRKAFIRHLQKEGINDLNAVEADTLVDRALDMMMGYQEAFNEMAMGRTKLARVLDRSFDKETAMRQLVAARSQETALAKQASSLKENIKKIHEDLEGTVTKKGELKVGLENRMIDAIRAGKLDMGLEDKDEIISRVVLNLDRVTKDEKLLFLRNEWNDKYKELQEAHALLNAAKVESEVVVRRKTGLQELISNKHSALSVAQDWWYDVNLIDMRPFASALQQEGRVLDNIDDSVSIFMPGDTGPNRMLNLMRTAQNNLYVGASNFERRIYDSVLGQIFQETGLHRGISARERLDMAESLAAVMRNKFGVSINEMYRIPGVERGAELYNKVAEVAISKEVFMSQLVKAMREVNVKAAGVAVDITNIVSRFAEERFKGSEVEPFIKDIKSGVRNTIKEFMRGEVHIPYIDVQFALSDTDRERARKLVAKESRGKLSSKEGKELSTLLLSWGEAKPSIMGGIVPGMEAPEAIYKMMLLDDGRIAVVRDLYVFSGTEMIKGVKVRAPLSSEWVEQHLNDYAERRAKGQYWEVDTEKAVRRKVIRVYNDVPGVDKLTYDEVLQAERKLQILKAMPEADADNVASAVLELILTKGVAKVQVAKGEIQALGLKGIKEKYADALGIAGIEVNRVFDIRDTIRKTPNMKMIMSILGAYKVEDFNRILDLKEFAWYKGQFETFVSVSSKIISEEAVSGTYMEEVLGKITYHKAVPIGLNFKEMALFLLAKISDPKKVSWGAEYRRLRGVVDVSTSLENQIGRLEREIEAVKQTAEDVKMGIRHIPDSRTNSFIPIKVVEFTEKTWPPKDIDRWAFGGKEGRHFGFKLDKSWDFDEYITKTIKDLKANKISLNLGYDPATEKMTTWNRRLMAISWVDQFTEKLEVEANKIVKQNQALFELMLEKRAVEVAEWLTGNAGVDISAGALSADRVRVFIDVQHRGIAAETDISIINALKKQLEPIESKGGLLDLVMEREELNAKMIAINNVKDSKNVKELIYKKGMMDAALGDPDLVQVLSDKPHILSRHEIAEELRTLEITLDKTRKDLVDTNGRSGLRRPVDVMIPADMHVDLSVVQAKLAQRISSEEKQVKALARPFRLALNRAHAIIDDATLAEFFKANTEYRDTLAELASLINRTELAKTPVSTYSQRLQELTAKLDSIATTHIHASKMNSAYVNMGEIYGVDMTIEEVLSDWWKRSRGALPKDLVEEINKNVVTMDAVQVQKYASDLAIAEVNRTTVDKEVRALRTMQGASIEEILSHPKMVAAQKVRDAAKAQVNISQRRAFDRAGAVFSEIDQWILKMTEADKQDTAPVKMVVAAFNDVVDRKSFAIKNTRDRLNVALRELGKGVEEGGFLQKDIDEVLKMFDEPRNYTDDAVGVVIKGLDDWATTRVHVLPVVNEIKEAMFQSRMSSRAYIETLQHTVMVLTDQSIPEEDRLVKYASKMFGGKFRDHIALAHMPPLLMYPTAGEENLKMMREFANDYNTTQANLYKNRDSYRKLLDSVIKSGGREYSNAELQAIVNRVGEIEEMEWGSGVIKDERTTYNFIAEYLGQQGWHKETGDISVRDTILNKAVKDATNVISKKDKETYLRVWRADNRKATAMGTGTHPWLSKKLKDELDGLRKLLDTQLKLSMYRLYMVRDFADMKAMRVAGAAGAYMSDTQYNRELRNMQTLNGQLITIQRAYDMEVHGNVRIGLPGRVEKEMPKMYIAPDGTVFMRQGPLVDTLARALGVREFDAVQDAQTGAVSFISPVEIFGKDVSTETPDRLLAVDEVLKDVDRQLALTKDKRVAPEGMEFKRAAMRVNLTMEERKLFNELDNIKIQDEVYMKGDGLSKEEKAVYEKLVTKGFPKHYDELLKRQEADAYAKLFFFKKPSGMTEDEWFARKMAFRTSEKGVYQLWVKGAYMQRLEQLQQKFATEAGVIDMRDLIFDSVHTVNPSLPVNDMASYHNLVIGITAEYFAAPEQRETFIIAANVYAQYFRDAVKLTSIIERQNALQRLWEKTGVAANVGLKSIDTWERRFEDFSPLLGKMAIGGMKIGDRLEELFTGLDMMLGNINGIGAIVGRDAQMRSNSAMSRFIRQAISIGRDAVKLQGAASILKASYRHTLNGVSYSAKDIVGQQVSMMFGGHALATFTGLKNIFQHTSYYAYAHGSNLTDKNMRILADELANKLPWDPQGKQISTWMNYVTTAGVSWSESKYGIRSNNLVASLFKSLDKSVDEMSRLIAQGVSPQTAAAKGYQQVGAAFRNLKQGEENLIGDAGYDGANTALSYAYADNVQLISKLEYVAVNDSRTCKYCRASDGVLYNVYDQKPSLPRHGNCRCTYRAWFRSPNEILPGTDVTEESRPVRLKRWINVGDDDLGGLGAGLNRLKPVKIGGTLSDEDWLKWFDEQKYPVREMMVGKDHALAHALGAFDDEDKFDKSRVVAATARDIISAAYSDTVKYAGIEMAKNFVKNHEVGPNLIMAVLDRKNAGTHLKSIPFKRLLLEPNGIVQNSIVGGINKMMGDVAGPGGALFSLVNKYVPNAVMKSALEVGSQIWKDINAGLPKYIADRLTSVEKTKLADAVSSVINKDTPYSKLGTAYARMMGIGDVHGKNVHEQVVSSWFGSMESLVDALTNTIWEIYSPTGGSPTKVEALSAKVQEQLAAMPMDEMQAALSRRVKTSGILGELPLREVPWMSPEAYENAVSVIGNAYTRKGGIETLDPKFLSEAKGWFTSGRVWESPELRRRIFELTQEQQAQVRMNVGFANQGQFDLLVGGGKIDTAISRFRVKSISPEGDIYAYNDLPAYGAKEMWGGPDGHLYVGKLDDIVDTMRVYDQTVDEAQFKKILVRYGPAEGGKRNISMMLEKDSQIRGAQNMIKLRQVEGYLQQGLERMMVDVDKRVYTPLPAPTTFKPGLLTPEQQARAVALNEKYMAAGKAKVTTNTVAHTLLGVEGRFVNVSVGSGRYSAPELVDRNFNAQVMRAIEVVRKENTMAGRGINLGDRQRVWDLAKQYIDQMEPSDIQKGVKSQLNNRFTSLRKIQELIAWASGIN